MPDSASYWGGGEMKRTKASFAIGSSLVLAITIAFIVSDYFGPLDNPEPLV